MAEELLGDRGMSEPSGGTVDVRSSVDVTSDCSPGVLADDMVTPSSCCYSACDSFANVSVTSFNLERGRGLVK